MPEYKLLKHFRRSGELWLNHLKRVKEKKTKQGGSLEPKYFLRSGDSFIFNQIMVFFKAFANIAFIYCIKVHHQRQTQKLNVMSSFTF